MLLLEAVFKKSSVKCSFWMNKKFEYEFVSFVYIFFCACVKFNLNLNLINLKFEYGEICL